MTRRDGRSSRLVASAPRSFAQSRPIPLVWHSDQHDGHARTKFAVFVPGKYRATAGIMPARTDFTSGSLTAYIGRQRHARAALRAMLDYLVGQQEENPELTIFQSTRLELQARRRYLSVMIVNNDHYINTILHDPGRHELRAEVEGTRYVVVAARTLVDPSDDDPSDDEPSDDEPSDGDPSELDPSVDDPDVVPSLELQLNQKVSVPVAVVGIVTV